jgi:FkbM family methyltransferase
MSSKKKDEEVMLEFLGLNFVVPKETGCFWAYYGICFVGEYDQLLSHIRSSDVVVDAGANIGIFTLLAAKKAKLVIAVEPEPENFEYLRRNVRLNRAKNVILINKALSNYVGNGFICGRGPSAALSYEGTSIKVTTVDEMIKELGLDSFDVLKMDIEGEELKALNGYFLKNVRELMVECHHWASHVIRGRLEEEGFTVSEWSFSPFKVLKRILTNLRSFVNAELKIGFPVTTLILKYMLRLSNIRYLRLTKLLA